MNYSVVDTDFSAVAEVVVVVEVSTSVVANVVAAAVVV